MAIYAALYPLKRKIRGYLRDHDVCFNPPSLELAKYLYKEVISLQDFVERLDDSSRKAMNPSLLRIAEAIPRFHDLFSRHWMDEMNKDEDRRKRLWGTLGLSAEEEENRLLIEELLEYEGEVDGENQPWLPTDLLVEEEEEEEDEDERNRMSQLIDLRGIEQEIHSFVETLKRVQEECREEVNGSSSTNDSWGNKSKMVGLSDLYTELKEAIVAEWVSSFKLLSLVGMAGIGKTTLAKEIFEDLDCVEWFDHRAWVTVGREWQLQKIIRDIVAQFKPDEMLLMEEKEQDDDDDGRMRVCLNECLEGKRYLIVLDDVWDVHVWDEVKKVLESTRNNKVKSRVLLTTRIRKVGDRDGLSSGLSSFEMRLLDKEESWDLLRKKVFDTESCSFQLERIGRRISDKCHGLPLTIVVVAHLLSESDKTLEHWSEVAQQTNHHLFISAYDEVSKTLHPSYENLPHHLKLCLLYMGVFPQNHENNPASNVTNLWIAEGLVLDPNKGNSSKKHALKCLNTLASHNVIVFQNSTRSSSDSSIAKKEVKACGLHPSWWHLCYKEAMKNNFFHVLSSRRDSLSESIRGQTRLSIHNNTLLGIKEVYNSVEDNCGSSANSLLSHGPYSQYPIPICPSLKLLKVLDALKIRFYEFPPQVLELVELKYLALSYDGKIPDSISKLQKLQFLILCPHHHIKSGDSSYLPLEIWDITELKHLQAMGRDLPDSWGIPLLNLLTLLDVSGHSCTKGVFARIPNVRKLGIRIELEPDHSGDPMSCLDHISNLKNLTSLKCVIVNPELDPELSVSPPPTIPVFPKTIKKLTLSGMGYPWAEMSKIAALEDLEVLKLRCNAFQGERWEIEEKTFRALEYLLIEDCDLEHWKVGDGNFRNLEHLSIKHCYKLREVEWEFDELISWIEVVDCDPAVGNQIKASKFDRRAGALDFSLHYSWDEKTRIRGRDRGRE